MTTDEQRLSREDVEALIERVTSDAQQLSPKERSFVVGVLRQAATTAEPDDLHGYGLFVAEAVNREIPAESTGQPSERLSEEELIAIIEKMRGMNVAKSEAERDLLFSILRHAVAEEDGEDVSGYSYGVTSWNPNIGSPNPPVPFRITCY